MKLAIRTRCAVFLLSLGLSLAAAPAPAQIPFLGEPAKSEAPAADSLHRETPRDAFVNFIKQADLGNDSKASQYFQALPGKKPEEIQHLIDQFRKLLDLGYHDNLNSISDESQGNLNDGLTADEEKVGEIEIEGEKLPVMLKRLKVEDGRELWFISQETLSAVPGYFEKTALESQASESQPTFLSEKKILNISLSKWLRILGLLPLCFAICWLVVQMAVLPIRLAKRWLGRPRRPYPFKATLPFVLLLTGFLHYIFISLLGLPVLFRQYYARAIDAYILIGLAFLAYHFAEALMTRLQQRLLQQNRLNTQSMMTLLQKLVKAAILVMFVLAIARTFGFKITAALAGLGIGGIALAFAAQKTLENLFGGVSLLGDQVIRVGELCKIGDQLGTVEDISLRSTRIRTQDRTLLYVPNGALAVETLENYSQRDKFWFHHYLGLRYETKVEQIREILRDLQSLLEGHESVEKSTVRVRFIRLGAYSLDIEISAYILVSTQEENLKIAEELLLQIMEIVESDGAAFAFPSQTSYVAQDLLPTPKAPALPAK